MQDLLFCDRFCTFYTKKMVFTSSSEGKQNFYIKIFHFPEKSENSC